MDASNWNEGVPRQTHCGNDIYSGHPIEHRESCAAIAYHSLTKMVRGGLADF